MNHTGAGLSISSQSGQADPALAVGVDFWSDFNRGSMLSYYFLDSLIQLIDDHQADDDYESFNDAVTSLIQGMGYGIASADVLNTAYAVAAATSLSYWDGAYLLDLGDGTTASLCIEFGLPELTLGDQSTHEFKFADHVLEVWGESLSARLEFPPPPDAASRLAQGLRAGQPMLRGRLTVTLVGVARLHEVVGRRGCVDRLSIHRSGDGDPVSYWAGSYDLVLTDEGGWNWLDQALVLSGDGERASATFGDRRPLTTSFDKNLLILWFDTRQTDGLMANFRLDSDGTRRIRGVRVLNAVSHPLSGYARPRPGEVPSRLKKALAVVRDSSGRDVGLDRSSLVLDWAAASIGAIELPAGNEGSPYQLQLKISDPQHDRSTYAWRISQADAVYPTIVDLAANASDNSRQTATLRGTFGQTEHAGFLRFKVEVKRDNADTCEFDLTLAVLSLPPVVLSNEALPPITRGYDYVAVLRASGGKEPYTWDVQIPDGLPGFTFDASSGRLKGKLMATRKSQEMHSISATVYADTSVVMSPAHYAMHLKVEEPDQVGTNVTGWFQFVFDVLTAGGALLVLGQWLYSRHKRAREETKKVDPVIQLGTELKEFRSDFKGFFDTLNTVPKLQDLLNAELTSLDESIKKARESSESAQRDYDRALIERKTAETALKTHVTQHPEGTKLKRDAKQERDRLEAEVEKATADSRKAEKKRDRREIEGREHEARKERVEGLVR